MTVFIVSLDAQQFLPMTRRFGCTWAANKHSTSVFVLCEKKEEIWLRPMTKAPTPTGKIQKATRQHKNATKNFDYTTIADRLRTVSLGYHRIKRVVPCRCRTGMLKKPTKYLWRWEPNRRYNFFNPPAHVCRHIYDWNIVAYDVKHQ